MVPLVLKELEDILSGKFDRSIVEIRQNRDNSEPRERRSPRFGAGIDSVLEQPRGLLHYGVDCERWQRPKESRRV